jgi:hypothetical protein
VPGPVARMLISGAVVVVLAACSPPGNEAPPEVTPIAVLPSLTTGQARDYVSVAWNPASTPGAGQDLPVIVPGAGCGRLRGARVAETSTEVTVEVYASLEGCSEPVPGGQVAVVRLPSPLGGRRLRHGAATTLPSTRTPGHRPGTVGGKPSMSTLRASACQPAIASGLRYCGSSTTGAITWASASP